MFLDVFFVMDSAYFTLLGFGFVVGLKHAFEADHLAAVSTIVSQTRSVKKSSIIGAIWGLGHTTTLLLVGLLLLAFKITIPNSLALSLEFLVGLVLVILGIDVLRKVVRERMHFHAHTHGSKEHVHFHSHKSKNLHTHAHRSFLIGLVHGLAGSAALMLLVLATVDSVVKGLFYILIFGFGSVFGMLLMGGVIALPFLVTSKLDRVNQIVKTVAGAASIFLGVLIMYEIGITQGLLF